MGRVYLAHEVQLDRIVALKFIAQDEPDPEARARFMQEARAVARLQHPNVVAIYRVGEVERRPYIACEYVDGAGLEHLAIPVPWTRALEIGVAISRALAFAHRLGVLHRDIKPSNILLAKDGAIKLVDFGLAKVVAPRWSGPETSGTTVAAVRTATELGLAHASSLGTPGGSLVGTPRYIAPEVWAGAEASPRSDVYSIGLVLYELCTGLLSPEPSESELVELHARVPLPPLGSQRDDLPRSFSDVVDRAIEHDPEARFTDGAELLEALELIESVLRAFRQISTPRDGADDDATLVSASLSRVRVNPDQLMSAFYARLFQSAPDLRQLFPASMLGQTLMLASALRLAVDNLKIPGRLLRVLEDLGKRHASYGARREHFVVFRARSRSAGRPAGHRRGEETSRRRAAAAGGQAVDGGAVMSDLAPRHFAHRQRRARHRTRRGAQDAGRFPARGPRR